MTIALRSLLALDPTQVSQSLDLAITAIQEDNPSLDVSRRGSIYDILAYYHAVLATQLQQNIQDYLNGRSLAVIQSSADPNLIDPSLVDDIVSNFGITRNLGAQATGTVAIVVSSSTTLTLSASTQFQANGLTFTVNEVYTAKSDPTQINNSGDRLLTQVPNSTNWIFTVQVTADVAGSAGNLAADTIMTPTITPANFVQASAAGSFTGGQDLETNEQLITRLARGVAAKVPSNRTNFAALLNSISTYSTFVTMSAVGMGDPEQLRDKHSILPLSLGGKVDWYVRTQEALLATELTKTATCLSVDNTHHTSVWQFSVARDDAPGFYEIRNIRPLGAITGAGIIDSDVRSVDLSDLSWVPDIINLNEGEYTRYITTIVQFTDTVTPTAALTPGNTASYTCQAVGQPLIASIQDNLASAVGARSLVSDVLVKAPVPCFVTVMFNLNTPKANPLSSTTLAAIENAISKAVNNVGFTGTLYASVIQAAVAPFLLAGQTVSSISMQGRIRYPGGTNVNLTGSDIITVPNAPANMVTANTVQFYLDPTGIFITVVPF
jgi:hypothetical protein